MMARPQNARLRQRLHELRGNVPYSALSELRTSVEQGPSRLCIEIPPPTHPDETTLATFVLRAAWLGLSALVMWPLLAHLSSLGAGLVLVLALLWTAVSGALVESIRNGGLHQPETLTFERDEWSLSDAWTTRRFPLQALTAVRVRSGGDDSQLIPRLELVHAGGIVQCARGIDSSEAELLVELIEAWLAQAKATLR